MKLAPPPTERADDATGGRDGPVSPAPGGRGNARLARVLRVAAIVLAAVGVLALADGVLTLVWQEPITGLLAHFQQARLATDLKRLESEPATPADERALAALPSDNARMAYFARELQHTARAGQPVGRIRIPRIGADFVVVAGTDESSLKKGPGVYSGTSLPGLPGTVGIAGHRTTYLAPFRRINELAKGDRITLEMPYGLFSYTVLGHRIVRPNDVSVLVPAAYDQVVLTACNPLYSAAQRIVVFARLTAAEPAGPALSLVSTAPVQPAIPAALAAAAVIGDPGPDLLSPSVPPAPVDAPAVVLGPNATGPAPKPRRPAASQAKPRRKAAAAPSSAPRTPGVSRTPVAAPRTPAVAPAPVVRSPTPAVSETPSHPVVHALPPAPVHEPAAKAPSTSPTTAPAPAPPQQQTRVQGAPAGPTPIIGVPSN